MVAAVSADFDAQRRDLAQTSKPVLTRGRPGQRRMAAWVGQAHIDTRCAGHPVACDLLRLQHLEHGMLETVDVLLDVNS